MQYVPGCRYWPAYNGRGLHEVAQRPALAALMARRIFFIFMRCLTRKAAVRSQRSMTARAARCRWDEAACRNGADCRCGLRFAGNASGRTRNAAGTGIAGVA